MIPIVFTIKRGAAKTSAIGHKYPPFISPGVAHPNAGEYQPIPAGDFLRVGYKAAGSINAPPSYSDPELGRMLVVQDGSRWLATLSQAKSEALLPGRYYADARQFDAAGTTQRFSATIVFIIEGNVTGAANP